jgi:ABC-type sugar transport system ATPase subunit
MVEVTLRNVDKSFGTTRVLQGINAEIADGAFAVLVGPSGCGKSTLLRLIAGLEEVTSGTIHFGERDVTRLAPRERDVAMVFQSYALYPHMTVRQNLAFGLELRKTDKKTIARRVEEVAKTLEIGQLLDRHPRALSGGQRQRVAMGRAIVRRPAIFMFDEPLSNLDPALRNHVRVDIRKLHDDLGATSVYVTHDQVEAMTLADELFVLDQGIVQQRGRPIDIYDRPANRFVAGFLGSPAMNFASGHIATTSGAPSIVLGEGDHTISIPLRHAEAFGSLGPEHAVTLGIRPHDLRRVSEESAADIVVEAAFVETLGSHVNVHAELAGAPFIAALEGTRGPDKGDRIALHIEALHLFDAHSGESLRTEGS